MNPLEGEVTPAPRNHPQELRERDVRLVHEAMAQTPLLSVNAAVLRIGARVGVVPGTLRGWVKRVRVDQGLSPGTTTSCAARFKDHEREVKEVKCANEILLAASSFPEVAYSHWSRMPHTDKAQA